MKCINCTGTIRVAHELVDMTTPGFFCIITCCWLKCSKDGRKKWWGRRGGISTNISKTEGQKRKINCDERRIPRRWQIKHAITERYNHRTNYSTYLLSNDFWRLAGCWLQWEKPPNQNPCLQAFIIYLPPSQNALIVLLYCCLEEEGWNFPGG